MPVVEDLGTAILTGPESVPAGSSFTVEWKGPDSRSDYISISKKGAKDLTPVDYRYTKHGSPITLISPPEIGDYELCYQGFGNIVKLFNYLIF